MSNVTNTPSPPPTEGKAAAEAEDGVEAAEAEDGVEEAGVADQTVQSATGFDEEAEDDHETPAEDDEEAEREPSPAPATAGQGDGRQLRPRDRLKPPNRFLNGI
ncbi:hypothetical protein SASPL_113270 [Salvia splendens]|uniref:Uncharacterized protein n=1 Tax=Salvia splendens TaxID=180675 RepID=A0A8X8XZ91_SALSN|nr:hypothetical protein SASPL_113270 [Salvia splendens]